MSMPVIEMREFLRVDDNSNDLNMLGLHCYSKNVQ